MSPIELQLRLLRLRLEDVVPHFFTHLCSVYSIYFRTPFMVFYLFSYAFFYIIRNNEEASLRAPHKLLATTFCVQLIIDDARRGRDSVPCCWHHVADIKYKCTRAACAPFVCGYCHSSSGSSNNNNSNNWITNKEDYSS